MSCSSNVSSLAKRGGEGSQSERERLILNKVVGQHYSKWSLGYLGSGII